MAGRSGPTPPPSMRCVMGKAHSPTTYLYKSVSESRPMCCDPYYGRVLTVHGIVVVAGRYSGWCGGYWHSQSALRSYTSRYSTYIIKSLPRDIVSRYCPPYPSPFKMDYLTPPPPFPPNALILGAGGRHCSQQRERHVLRCGGQHIPHHAQHPHGHERRHCPRHGQCSQQGA